MRMDGKIIGGLWLAASSTGMAQSTSIPEAVPVVDEEIASPGDKQLENDIATIQSKYEGQLKVNQQAIEDESGDKAPIIAKGDCWWDTTSAKFDIPKTTFKNRNFSFDIPKTTFKLREMSFDYPRCEWKVMKIGFGIKTKFLKCGKETKVVKTKIPEFKMERTQFSTKIPEFKMDRTEVKFDTLKCKVDELYVGPTKPSKESLAKIDQAGRNIEQIAEAQQADIIQAIENDIDRRGEVFAQQLKDVEVQFDTAIAELDASIDGLSKGGVDPAVVVADVDGKQMSLPQMRTYLVSQKEAVLAQMSSSWEASISEMKAGMAKV